MVSKFDYYDINPSTGNYRHILSGQDALPKSAEQKFNLKAPDGRIAEFPFSNVNKALEGGFVPVTDNVNVIAPDGRKATLQSIALKQALDMGFMLDGPDISDYGQAAVKGLTQGLGKIADTAIAAGSYGLSNSSLYKGFKSAVDTAGVGNSFPTQEDLSKQAADYYKNPKIEKVASDAFQGNIDTVGIRTLETAGEFVPDLLPFNVLGKASKALTILGRNGTKLKAPFLNNINKFLETPINSKTVAGFAGAGAGSELAKTEGASETENMMRSFFGALAGGITVEHYAVPALKSAFDHAVSLPKTIKNFPSLKELPDNIRASIISKFGTDIDLAGFNAFKEAGIDPTPEMILEKNKLVSILAKQKSALADKIIDNANSKSLDSIEAILDKNLGEYIGRNESDIKSAGEIASDMFTSQVKTKKDELDLIKKQKYYEATSSLNMKKFPVAKEVIKTVKQELKFVKAPSTLATTDSGQGLVATVLDRIKKDWSVKGKPIRVDPQEMVAQENALSELKRKVSGAHAKRFQSIRDAIDRDLESVGNKDFIAKYRSAKLFDATEVVPFTKTDMARAILEGTPPKLAYSFTSNSKGIMELKEMVSRHPKGEELVNILLRTKAQERIIEGFTKRGQFNSNKFLETFNNSKNDEYLKALLGNETFIEIKNKGSVLAQALDRTARAFENPIGTANNLAYLTGIYKTGKGLITGNVKELIEGLGIQLLPKMFANALLTPGAAKKLVENAEKANDKVFMNILIKTNKTWLQKILNQLNTQGSKAAVVNTITEKSNQE